VTRALSFAVLIQLPCRLATEDELPKPFGLCRWRLQRVVPLNPGRLLQQMTAVSQDDVWGIKLSLDLGLFGLTLERIALEPSFLLGPASGLSRPFWLFRFIKIHEDFTRVLYFSGSLGRAGCGVVKRTCSICHA